MGRLAELRQYSNRKFVITLLAMMGLAILTSCAATFSIYSLVHTNRDARGVRDRQLAIDNAYRTLRALESDQRGYLLTGNPRFLQNYEAASAKLDDELALVRRIGLGGVQGAQDITAILPLFDAKVADMDATLELNQQGNGDAAMTAVATDRGEALVRDIGGRIDRYDADRQAQLNSLRAKSAGLGDMAQVVAGLVALITLVLAALIYYLYLKAIAAERELDRAKDEFVSLASHQLRTPATGIKSILAMVIAGDFGELNDKQVRYLTKALESNEREIGIIEELLNVAKADAGRLILRPGQVDLVELIGTIVAEQRPEIERKGQKLSVRCPKAAVVLQADAEKLYMAIGNLLDNARKYTPEDGSIELVLRDRRGAVTVEVADSGIGIDKTDLGRVFDRFHRGRSVLSADIEGTGLGLYLTRRIVELHNGTIKVNSQKGHGSRFTMTLPQGRA